MKRPLILGSLVLVGVLAASVWSYRTSLNRIGVEPFIAVVRPGSINSNPFNITGFTTEGKLRVYSSPSFGDDIIKYKFLYNNQTYEYNITGYTTADTTFSVKPGDTINLTISNAWNNIQLYGWAAPTDQGVGSCITKLQGYVSAAQTANFSIVSQQCWNDDNNGDDNYDDLAILIAQMPGAVASPSPSPSPSSSPSASPEPSPSASPTTSDQTRYQVRPFNDANRNGVRDNNEGQIAEAEFKYKISINSDPPQDYTVGKGSDGSIITAGQGAKLTVEQVDQPGWIRTTSQTVVLNMTDKSLYQVDFGNYNPAAGGGIAAPTQPDTGTPTALTLSLLVAAPLLYFLRKRYDQKK
jgi:hypothetical protein